MAPLYWPYTQKELELLRQQLKDAAEKAREVAESRGYAMHPRVAAIKRRAAPLQGISGQSETE